HASAGSIGGGQLEYHCVAQARDMLTAQEARRDLDIPLGPQMGQCCGGRARVLLERATADHVAVLAEAEAHSQRIQPHVFIYGAGHTGRALAQALALLPLGVTLVDDREGVFGGLPDGLVQLNFYDPVEALLAAPAGAAHVILTHSHALDYRLAEAALRRGDTAYVGLIGSATKKARFAQSFQRNGGSEAELSRLVCPIGGAHVRDKRPEVIAALVAAELVGVLLG
ncbi:MAG: xanthine dehydrogenase accessory protein XdhC, partial [Bosea sp. (in: a-proteobacteria)]